MTTTMNDYSLTGANARRAIERGLAEADWYTCPVPREHMRQLLERRDGPAIRDTLVWFALLASAGCAGWMLWGSWWAVIPFAIYGVIYASTSDSRWHESSHGTAFQTDWMNDVLYEIASFMVMREPTPWRWSHTRHHSDTSIVGRDPEIAVPRPPRLTRLLLAFVPIHGVIAYLGGLLRHSCGRISEAEATYIPSSEFGRVARGARIHLAIHLTVIALAMGSGSILPLMFIGLPNLYGAWLMPIYGLTQHAGLAEDVLDHRLSCRTVAMNGLNRYLYWNMNYHIEHHMFPLVPYHALPRLHEAIKSDTPAPYDGIIAAFREIIPAVLRQRREPGWHVRRALPPPPATGPAPTSTARIDATPDASGWLPVGPAHRLSRGQVVRCDHGRRTYALYLTEEGDYHATDGICTHGNSHLAEGLVKGRLIECPKHNGRFQLSDGAPVRPPVCRALRTYPLENRNGTLWLNLAAGNGGREPATLRFRVASNRLVSTYITELVLEPLDGPCRFTPGDYLQLDIPAFGSLPLRALAIPEPYAEVWRAQGLLDLVAIHDAAGRRNNYSIASGPGERGLRFTIRIAAPPPGIATPGIGSTWIFSLKPGDTVTGIGPFGDFHAKPTLREMVYIGGGAGMAPIRSHLLHLFGERPTARRVSFWYGARSRRDLFYAEEFADLAVRHANFSFHPALSAAETGDVWQGYTGFIHDVVRDRLLATHPDPRAIEFYLCGPPRMIEACTAMLGALKVDPQMIVYDAF
jgi:Na+-transporting NADH:ubiquinone oxidoreductase subunit F